MRENILKFDNIDQAQIHFYKLILEKGTTIITRGLSTLEVYPVYFSITNPRARITTLKGRNWKLAPAIGELSWHLSGSRDLNFISSYLANWKKFSEDNIHIKASCYGYKIFERNSLGANKWSAIISLFREDLYTRRAVISLFDPKDEVDSFSLDLSCTMAIQFLVRESKLDLIVTMRSNDLVWGLPYDFFLFSYLQELMANEIGVPLGNYYHFAGSLHIYERHVNLAEKVLAQNTLIETFQMPAAPKSELDLFLKFEFKVRNCEIDYYEIDNFPIAPYWKDLLKVLFFNKVGQDNYQQENRQFKESSIYGNFI